MIPVEIQYELKDLDNNKDMVLKLLQKLKTDKSPGPDSLHPRLLFEIKESIAEPLSIIFNQSLALKTVQRNGKMHKLVQFPRRVINHRQKITD